MRLRTSLGVLYFAILFHSANVRGSLLLLFACSFDGMRVAMLFIIVYLLRCGRCVEREGSICSLTETVAFG